MHVRVLEDALHVNDGLPHGQRVGHVRDVADLRADIKADPAGDLCLARFQESEVEHRGRGAALGGGLLPVRERLGPGAGVLVGERVVAAVEDDIAALLSTNA